MAAEQPRPSGWDHCLGWRPACCLWALWGPSTGNALQASLAGSFPGGRLLGYILRDPRPVVSPQECQERGVSSQPLRESNSAFPCYRICIFKELCAGQLRAKKLHLKIQTSSGSQILSVRIKRPASVIVLVCLKLSVYVNSFFFFPAQFSARCTGWVFFFF